MSRQWSFHRSSGRKKTTVWLVLAGIGLFILGFFAARPILLILGLVS